jgi:putative sterol carrier protein
VNEPRVRYLSLEWIEALSHEVAKSDALRDIAATHTVGITQVVSNGPEGNVLYHLQVGDGQVAFGPGPADPEDVRFEQDWDTAVAVATEQLNAQQAFITGRIRLTGDQHKLLESTPVFAALDIVFTTVRGRTDYV